MAKEASTVTLSKLAIIISKTAEEGLAAALKTFTFIAQETFRTYTDVNFIGAKYYSAEEAFADLQESVNKIKITESPVELSLIADSAEWLVGNMYAKKLIKITNKKRIKVPSIPRITLLLLVDLIQKYKAVSLHAKLFSQTNERFDKLLEELEALEDAYGRANSFSKAYTAQFRILQSGNQIAEITAVRNLMIKEMRRAETQVIST